MQHAQLLLTLVTLLALAGCGSSARSVGQSDDPLIRIGMTPAEVAAEWGHALKTERHGDGTMRMVYRSEFVREIAALSTEHSHWAEYDADGHVTRWH